jgi:hypothetical protein
MPRFLLTLFLLLNLLSIYYVASLYGMFPQFLLFSALVISSMFYYPTSPLLLVPLI